MKCFISSMERLENKIERLSNKNTLLKQEVESLKQVQIFKTNGLKKERDI